jgi:hypothetical protein
MVKRANTLSKGGKPSLKNNTKSNIEDTIDSYIEPIPYGAHKEEIRMPVDMSVDIGKLRESMVSNHSILKDPS